MLTNNALVTEFHTLMCAFKQVVSDILVPFVSRWGQQAVMYTGSQHYNQYYNY